MIEMPVEEEMKTAYINYAMSVIVARALPDVRDGLKPVQRRVLYGMYELGLLHNRPYRKSARVVGEVLGKYHPHGDAPVYEAMVRMAQEWVMRYPLVDGQGNFGSIDGDGPAAMRYTEVRLTRLAEELLADIDKNTVNFQPNFDGSLQEPVVLPSRFPNLLVNGASGIAVGMATSIPPHNLGEVIDGIVAYIDNPNIDTAGLMRYIKGPDFPTGGVLYGRAGIIKAYETGKGRAVVRAVIETEKSKKGGISLVVKEIPYGISKASIIMRVAKLVNDKRITGIQEIRDESDREGMRVVFELRSGANPRIVLNQLYKYTPLKTTFHIQQIVLVNGRPRQLSLKELIAEYVKHRLEVLVRKTRYELDEAQQRLHIVEGLLKALDKIDEVIELIKKSESPRQAEEKLIELLSITQQQAQAILAMRLQQLTGLERTRLQEEHKKLTAKIEFCKRVLEDEHLRKQLIKEDLLKIKEQYADQRKTKITEVEDHKEETRVEDLIENVRVVVTLTASQYIKRTPLEHYRHQLRGGKGITTASPTSDSDHILEALVAYTHDRLLLFTDRGRCFSLKVYELPEGVRTARGRHLTNILAHMQEDERVVACIPLRQRQEADIDGRSLVFITRKGVIKRTPLKEFARLRQSGLRALTIKEDDRLVTVRVATEHSHILVVNSAGYAIRFPADEVRLMGRMAAGVRAMRLPAGAHVVDITVFEREEGLSLLTTAEKGYGKRTLLSEYRTTHRGGKGIKAMAISQKTGKLCAALTLTETDEVMLITRKGMSIRLKAKNIPMQGRVTQGVRLMRLDGEDTLTAVTKIPSYEQEPATADAGTLFSQKELNNQNR